MSITLVAQNKKTEVFYEEDQSVNLYAFIGKKISVEEFTPIQKIIKKLDTETGDSIIVRTISMDNAFKVKYKIIQKLFNDLKTDTIEFVAYDHYGRPGFEEFEYSILYISKNSEGNGYYHRKYQFDGLYKDQNDEWFSFFFFKTPEDLETNSKLKSFKIDLGDKIEYDVSMFSDEVLKTYFPDKFYKIKNKKARPLRAARPKELFLSKKESVFREEF